jgi:hypothetical protein
MRQVLWNPMAILQVHSLENFWEHQLEMNEVGWLQWHSVYIKFNENWLDQKIING